MNVVVFPDRLALGARENLANLIERARTLQVFGPTVDFDSPAWDLTHCLDRKPGQARKTAVLYFTVRQEKRSRTMEGRTEMLDSFAQFIKAMIVMRHFARMSLALHKRAVMVARVLYETLAYCGHDIVEARTSDFLSGAATIAKVYNGHSAYVCGEELERIAAFIDKHQICKSPIRFSNPIERTDGYSYRLIDEQSREARSKKLPTEEYIAAVVEASIRVRNGGTDPDLARMAVLECLLSAPWRINELLGLRADCERWDARPDGSVKFGIAHEGSKEAPDAVKFVPTDMKPIAERAIKDLIRLTEPSRAVARWMEEHPGRAWLPETWRLRDRATPMTATEIAAAMGFANRRVATVWMKERGYSGRVVRHQMTFEQGHLEDAILSKVKTVMKEVPKGRRLSEYLFLFPKNYFHREREPGAPIPTFLAQSHMRDFLVGGDGRSIFERLNILDASGKPFKVPSHGPRHYLNNMANEGLLSDLDIARWSGRKDVSQNAAYDHTGGAPLGRVMRELAKTKAMQGAIVATVKKLRPAAREDFLKARFATAHTTDIGMCVQDWSLAPCPSHGACAAGCGDHMLIKGNQPHQRRAEQLLAEHEAMLAQAKQEMGEGTLGAGPWVEHNEKMVEGLKKALAVHADDGIADGTVVQV
jgi:hypothetical protein